MSQSDIHNELLQAERPADKIRTVKRMPAKRSQSYAFAGSTKPLLGKTVGDMFDDIAEKYPESLYVSMTEPPEILRH